MAGARAAAVMAPPPLRLTIINGFGMTLGDSLIGLSALSAALAVGALGTRRPLLVRKPLFGRRLVNALYRLASPFADVTWLPYRARERPPFEKRISMREFAFDPAFHAVSMVDFFLRRLGTDPALIASARKRNCWLAKRLSPRRPAGLPARYILVCPCARVGLRTMPEPVHARIIAALLALQHLPIVTQGRLGSSSPRLFYCPACRSLAELAGLIRGAELIISTDTGIVHLADAWDVPTLAFFVTHRPEWRVRDYPFCSAVHLPSALPPALEFPRDARDLALAAAAWRGGGADFAWLTPLLRAALARPSGYGGR